MGQARGAGHSQEQREALRGFSGEPHGITDFTYDSHRSQQGKCFESRPGKGGASSRATSCVWRARCPKHEYQNAQTFWFRKTGVGPRIHISAGSLRRPGFSVGMSGVRGHSTPKACAWTPPCPGSHRGPDRGENTTRWPRGKQRHPVARLRPHGELGESRAGGLLQAGQRRGWGSAGRGASWAEGLRGCASVPGGSWMLTFLHEEF